MVDSSNTNDTTGDTNTPSMPPMSVGAILSVTRESKGLTIDAVASSLRIGPKQVLAIESNAFDQLPDAMIARGFIRNYAKLLGLDSDPLIAKLKMQQPDVAQKTISMPSANIVMSEDQKKSMMMYVGASVLVLVGLLLWYAYVEWMPSINQQLHSATASISDIVPADALKNGEEATPPQTTTELASPSTASASSGVAEVPAPNAVVSSEVSGSEVAAPTASSGGDVTQVANPEPLNSQAVAPAQIATVTPVPEPVKQTATFTNLDKAKTSKSLVVDCKETTWVHVRDANGLVIFDRVLPAGSHEVITGQSPLGVVIGNAPATTLKYGQDAVDLSSFTKIRVARLTLE